MLYSGKGEVENKRVCNRVRDTGNNSRDLDNNRESLKGKELAERKECVCVCVRERERERESIAYTR